MIGDDLASHRRELDSCSLMRNPEGETIEECCLQWAGSSWLRQVPELCSCPGRLAGMGCSCAGHSREHSQHQCPVGCVEGSFGTSALHNNVILLDFCGGV